MDEYLGVIKLFAINFVPIGYLPCDGREMEITQNHALYALIGNQFGGDKNRSFKLPDLRGKEPLANTHYMICVQGIFPTRSD